MQQLHMSARAYHRILKLARTIADLAGSLSASSCCWSVTSSLTVQAPAQISVLSFATWIRAAPAPLIADV
jgi:hypothetical protein